MALESVLAIAAAAAPPSFGAPHKETQNAGDYDSEETQVENESALQATEEDIDLEEGEIVDSEGDEQAPANEKSTNKDEVPSGDHGTEQPKAKEEKPTEAPETRKKKRKKTDSEGLSASKADSKVKKLKKKKIRYIDHDRVPSDEVSWFLPGGSPSYSPRHLSRRHYRREGDKDQEDGYQSPYGSPKRSPGPYDSPYESDNSNEYRRRSSSPFSSGSYDGEEKTLKSRQAFRQKMLSKKQLMLRRKRKLLGLSRPGLDKKRPRLLMSKRIMRRELKSKVVCKFYLEGKCVKGKECQFLHNVSPLKKKELCKFYLNGYCAKSDKCLFMHNDFPCKFFHSGVKCYSEPNCKFSHTPLNDEMKRILERHLECGKLDGHEQDDSFLWGDRIGIMSDDEQLDFLSSRPKRPSLLGSPPRHLKEAEETKRWQQQLLEMQQRTRGRFGNFRVPLPSKDGSQSPPHMQRPNFYTDTLLTPPKKGQSACVPDGTDPKSQQPEGAEGATQLPNDDSDKMAQKSPSEDLDSSKPNQEEEQELSCLEAAGVKQDLEIELPENKAVQNLISLLRPKDDDSQAVTQLPSQQQQDSSDSSSQQLPSDNSTVTQSAPPTATISVPSHLPKKQRELFLRIQQHQKVAAEQDQSGADTEESESSKTEGEQSQDNVQAKEEEKEDHWYSSDDDDDSEDQPLAAMLKKLQETPPAVQSRRPQNAAVTPSINTSTQQPAIDISRMLTSIRNQASSTAATGGMSIFSQQNDFWKNLLSAATAPPASTVSGSSKAVPASPKPSRDPRIRSSEIRQQNTASDTDHTMASAPRNQGPHGALASLPSRDPRLQSRDPRVARDLLHSNVPSSPVTTVVTPLPSSSPSPPQVSDVIPLAQVQEKLREVRVREKKVHISALDGSKTNSASIPYKLMPIHASLPNYGSYAVAGHFDIKTITDPRLKKYSSQIAERLQQQLAQSVTELPGQALEPNQIPKVPDAVLVAQPWLQEGQEVPWNNLSEPPHLVPEKRLDPRTVRTMSADPRLARQQQRKITPPAAPTQDNQWNQPDTPLSILAPLLQPMLRPPMSSHLPRSMIDPRLVRLHNPHAVQPVVQTPSLPPAQLQSQIKCHPATGPKGGVTTTNSEFSQPTNQETIQPQLPDSGAVGNTKKTEGAAHSVSKAQPGTKASASSPPQTESKSTSKESKKKKLTSHNRKSSMDYASPLSSYDDATNSSSNNSYNSYNRRPQQRVSNSLGGGSRQSPPPPPPPPPPPMPESRQTPQEALGPSAQSPLPSYFGTEAANSVVGELHDLPSTSLKDMFKTIDPTASPFC